jgi:flagellar basal body-associated protein FliL
MADDDLLTDEETPEAAEGAEAPPSRSARLGPLLVALGCVLTGSVLGAVALPTALSKLGGGAPAPRAPVRQPEARAGVPTEPLGVMVNLADERGRRVLKADIVFEVKGKEAKAEIEKRKIEIQHLLISLLSEKRLEDVEGKKEKERLLREIRLTINEHLGVPDAILHVYFAQFLVQ